MRNLKLALALCATLIAFVCPAAAQSYTKIIQPWFQQGKISGGISVTNSSAATVLPAAGQQAWICNTGANDVYLAFGPANTVTTATTTGSWLKAGTCWTYDLLPFTQLQRYVAAITASSTTTLTVETGIGTGPYQLSTSGGGGSGGTSSSFGAAFPGIGTAIGMSQGGNMVAFNGLAGNLLVNCAVGCSGGTFNNNADAVSPSSTNGQAAAWLYGFNGTTYDRLRVDGSKNLLIGAASGAFASGSLAVGAGADGWNVTMGTKGDSVCGTATGSCSEISLLKYLTTASANPPPLNLNTVPTAWTGLTPGVAQTGTIVAANVDLTSKGGVAYGAMTNFGTTPGAVKVDGVNASLFMGTSIISATNGIYSNLLQGNAVISATNGLFANALQGNAVLSLTNPSFDRITDGTTGITVKPGSTPSVASDTALVVDQRPGTTVATRQGYGAAQITHAAFDISASGDNIVVTRAVGTIKIYGIDYSCATNQTTVSYKNGASTTVGGPYYNVGSHSIPLNAEPRFTTTGTNNFIMNLAGATHCGGTVDYSDN